LQKVEIGTALLFRVGVRLFSLHKHRSLHVGGNQLVVGRLEQQLRLEVLLVVDGVVGRAADGLVFPEGVEVGGLGRLRGFEALEFVVGDDLLAVDHKFLVVGLLVVALQFEDAVLLPHVFEQHWIENLEFRVLPLEFAARHELHVH